MNWCRVCTGSCYLLLRKVFGVFHDPKHFETLYNNLVSYCLALLNNLDVWKSGSSTVCQLEVWPVRSSVAVVVRGIHGP